MSKKETVNMMTEIYEFVIVSKILGHVAATMEFIATLLRYRIRCLESSRQ